jgi:hypothetical protein
MRNSLSNTLGFFFVVVHDQHKRLESRHDTNRINKERQTSRLRGQDRDRIGQFLVTETLIDKSQVIVLSLSTSRVKAHCVMAVVRPASLSSVIGSKKAPTHPQHGIESTNSIHFVYPISR